MFLGSNLLFVRIYNFCVAGYVLSRNGQQEEINNDGNKMSSELQPHFQLNRIIGKRRWSTRREDNNRAFGGSWHTFL